MEGQTIEHIFLIEFHHKSGPQIEFVYPETKPEDQPKEWENLPWICLPDGSHKLETDLIYFCFPVTEIHSGEITTLYGIASYRQIKASDLIVSSTEFTRSFVQKSVCVLSKYPLYGFLAAKLSVISKALFNQKDFTSIKVLQECYENINSTKVTSIDDTQIYEGLSLRNFIKKFQHKSLILLKLLLLQKRVMCTADKVEELSSSMLTLVSLLPDYFKKDMNLESDEKTSSYGFPLKVFTKENIFHPFIILQQMELLSDPTIKSYLLGANNRIFLTRPNIDVIVNFTVSTIEIASDSLDDTLSLNKEDLRFMNEIVEGVASTEEDEVCVSWVGSDGWIRSQFAKYLSQFLATLLVCDMKNEGYEDCEDFGLRFTKEFKKTTIYEEWKNDVSPDIVETAEKGHPNKGSVQMSDVRLRLQSAVKNRFTNEELKEMEEKKEKIGTSIAKAWKSMFSSSAPASTESLTDTKSQKSNSSAHEEETANAAVARTDEHTTTTASKQEEISCPPSLPIDPVESSP